MDISPDFGADDLRSVVGALLTIVLVTAVHIFVTCAVVWAIATSHGNHQTEARARTGAWTAMGVAALAGGRVAWMNWLLALGSTL